MTAKARAPQFQALKEIEQAGIPGFVGVLREEGIDGVRYALWNATGRRRDYSLPAWRSLAAEAQKRICWELAMRIEKIVATVLDETHKRQVEEIMEYSPRGRNGYTNALRIDPEHAVYARYSRSRKVVDYGLRVIRARPNRSRTGSHKSRLRDDKGMRYPRTPLRLAWG